jgi:hypothetical protein
MWLLELKYASQKRYMRSRVEMYCGACIRAALSHHSGSSKVAEI